ncbi:PREDICTED: GDSL esterase/lipase LTL1-like isoform X1 [Lupinus angustifolius]|uniref:GDSL esterase/lipase LTL1-like isoform X1 n=1 Tax=Lupinus angustifolius TaxID=3871 RepID=UPI00092E6DA1|nr:PREDICTED: GDSL esterase/lipase LTL1-like isoform X1 [Lupinus angustifolius]
MASNSSLVILSLVVVFGVIVHRGEARPRAFFVFGDSLVDSGNNNYLLTTARADSPPYGIDHPTHKPTGRFSNGFNIPDLISQKLGAESPLPYLSPELTGEKLLIGANFASAGVGILNDTGAQFLNVIRMYKQLEYFKRYQNRMSAIIGASKTKSVVNQALVLISAGGNDFVNNYYLIPNSTRSQQYPLPQYVKLLISEYQKLLQKLYDLGARRVIVTGTGPMGCAPAELAQRKRKGTNELQLAAALFNPQLQQILLQLNNKIGTHVFIAANTAKMHNNFVSNPTSFGFKTSKIACCGQGPYNGLGLCTPFSNLCPDRNLNAFWDAFHPTEKANRLIVEEIMSGSKTYMNPMNLSTIMALDSST